jgi:hypothetical protein
MKKPGFINSVLISAIILIPLYFTNCKKTDDPIKFPKGIFPDSVIRLDGINSPYDDYNMALPQIVDYISVIFSSNRKSAGGQFDLEQGTIRFVFDQTNAAFNLLSEITTDPFLTRLTGKAVTPGNDFGPYRLFSKVDGFEYLILSSVNSEDNLDLFYLKNQPSTGSVLSEVSDPLPVKLINTISNDAYLSFNSRQDTAYFCSDSDGNFDIFHMIKPEEKDLTSWFNGDYSNPVKTDSINGQSDDKCPYILWQIMVFASNRPGGYGGYDLYYSVLKNGKWSSAVNLGADINTSSDEYRPVIGYHPDFTNGFMIFSSDRPGGKGGFDLYFTGFDYTAKK